MSNKRQSTKVRLLLTPNDTSPMYVARYDPRVEKRIKAATELFGKPGTNRRWHYRHNSVFVYTRVAIQQDQWYSYPAQQIWFDMYFRDPGDAAWFQLKFQL